MDPNNFDSYDDDEDCSSERNPHSYTRLPSPSDNRMTPVTYMPFSPQRQEPVYITNLSNGSGAQSRTGSSPDPPAYIYGANLSNGSGVQSRTGSSPDPPAYIYGANLSNGSGTQSRTGVSSDPPAYSYGANLSNGSGAGSRTGSSPDPPTYTYGSLRTQFGQKTIYAAKNYEGSHSTEVVGIPALNRYSQLNNSNGQSVYFQERKRDHSELNNHNTGVPPDIQPKFRKVVASGSKTTNEGQGQMENLTVTVAPDVKLKKRCGTAAKCPMPDCDYSTKSLKMHAYYEHFPPLFTKDEPPKNGISPVVWYQKKTESLVYLATLIYGRQAAIEEVASYANLLVYPPNTYITPEAQDKLRKMCKTLGWQVPSTFNINPINSPASLCHWRVLLTVLGSVSTAIFNQFIIFVNSLDELTKPKDPVKVDPQQSVWLDFEWPAHPKTIRQLELEFIDNIRDKINPRIPLILQIKGNEYDMYNSAIGALGLTILKDHCYFKQPILLHSFSGSPEDVHRWSQAFPNTYFGFSDLVAKYDACQREGLQAVPSDRIILEGSMLPSMQDPNNLTAYIGDLTAVVARVRGITSEELTNLTCINVNRLYH